ncbi:MAG: serine/threonine-protein kinase [Polyangiaceae bacterium]
MQPGTVLAERYRLESILGQGAFGVVWKARHVHLDTECAVKLLDPPPGLDPQDTTPRFLREARVMARLKCPYVAQVFDYGMHERMPFLVLELLHGTNLGAHLRRKTVPGQGLPWAETARLIRNVSEALQLAHAERVVHRDLKPDNIFLVRDGDAQVAKVLDFGIAKWSTDVSPGMTTTSTVMGTAHYMSPEQFESARHVDHRADLWSLGVIAFECLTGVLPFPGGTFIDVAFRVCKQGPLVASKIAVVPSGFDAWFARSTALQREHRFGSALEQAEALEYVCAEASEPVEPVASRAPTSPLLLSHPLPLSQPVPLSHPLPLSQRDTAKYAMEATALAEVTDVLHLTRPVARPTHDWRRRAPWLGAAVVLGVSGASYALFEGATEPPLTETMASVRPSELRRVDSPPAELPAVQPPTLASSEAKPRVDAKPAPSARAVPPVRAAARAAPPTPTALPAPPPTLAPPGTSEPSPEVLEAMQRIAKATEVEAPPPPAPSASPDGPASTGADPSVASAPREIGSHTPDAGN